MQKRGTSYKLNKLCVEQLVKKLKYSLDCAEDMHYANETYTTHH